jgi:hypothetical protein
MTKAAFIVRDKNGVYQKPRLFAEEDHPLFKPPEIRLRPVDYLLALGLLTSFMSLLFMLAK